MIFLFNLSETSMEFELEDEKLNKYEYLGLILIDFTLVPRYINDEKDNSVVSLHFYLINIILKYLFLT